MTHFTDKIITLDQKIKLLFFTLTKNCYTFVKVITVQQFTKKYSYNLFHMNILPL